MGEGRLSGETPKAKIVARKRAMASTIKFITPIELSFQPVEKVSLFKHLEPKPIRLNSIREPDLPLWKLSAQAVSPKLALIDLFILIVLLVVALIGTISCFAELSHLLESDAIWRVVVTAVAGGV